MTWATFLKLCVYYIFFWKHIKRHLWKRRTPCKRKNTKKAPTGGGDAVFLDSRSVEEFDRGHIVGAWSFAERSPLLRRLIQELEDLEKTANPALKQLLRFPEKLLSLLNYFDNCWFSSPFILIFPSVLEAFPPKSREVHPGFDYQDVCRLVIVYSDSGSDDLSLGYISRCVRVTQELRRICRQQPSLGHEKRVVRLIGGLNQWKRAGFPVNGDERPLINNHVLYEGGIHGYLNLENDIWLGWLNFWFLPAASGLAGWI